MVDWSLVRFVRLNVTTSHLSNTVHLFGYCHRSLLLLTFHTLLDASGIRIHVAKWTHLIDQTRISSVQSAAIQSKQLWILLSTCTAQCQTDRMAILCFVVAPKLHGTRTGIERKSKPYDTEADAIHQVFVIRPYDRPLTQQRKADVHSLNACS